MNIILFIKQAILSIISNKLRSFLSTLWIIIWISSFVIMLSLWEWAKQSILKDFSSSSNIITIVEKISDWDLKWKNILLSKNWNLILDKIPWVTNVIINYDNPSLNTMYLDTNIWWTIMGIDIDYMKIKEAELYNWTFFDENNFINNDKKVILWNKLIWNNFNGENPLWKKIIIWWEVFIIWWILKEKNWQFDYNIFIPSSTLMKVFNIDKIISFEVIVDNEKNIDKIKWYLNYFLYKLSFVNDPSEINFELRTNLEELKEINWFITKFSLLLWWIWAISLIVWWIWIMNIMLVSVTERTREIWIRKSIWATNFNILSQFLIESVILTLIWSIIAILFSILVVKIIDWFIPDFSPVINFNVIIISTSVSIFMWILFWLMPAYKAAKLKPIDALHFE